MSIKEDAIQLTRKLIQIDSTNPGKMEWDIADFLKAEIKKVLRTNGTCVCEKTKAERPILMAAIPGEKPEEELVFICHMDTVPLADGWTKNALGADLIEDKIYGRGACDMKSGLASALCAFLAIAKQLQESGKEPQRTLKFIATCDEEGDMTGVERAVEAGWVNRNSLVMDTEPTYGEIQTAHKGRYWFDLQLHGQAAHASKPEKGIDAISGMAYTIAAARDKVNAMPKDAFLGKSTIVFGEIRGGIHPYQVPEHCRVSVDMRVIPPFTAEDMKRMLEEAVTDAAGIVPGLTGVVKITGNRPPVAHYEDAEILKRLKNSVEKVTGEVPEVTAFPGYTDTAVIAGLLNNRNCLSYGPGNLAQAHKPDEYVEIGEIDRCVEVCYTLAESWVNGN